MQFTNIITGSDYYYPRITSRCTIIDNNTKNMLLKKDLQLNRTSISGVLWNGIHLRKWTLNETDPEFRCVDILFVLESGNGRRLFASSCLKLVCWQQY